MSLSASFGESAHGETETNKTVHGASSKGSEERHRREHRTGSIRSALKHRSAAPGVIRSTQISHNPNYYSRLLDTLKRRVLVCRSTNPPKTAGRS